MRFRKSKRAAVLGCGPAGLFAAHGLLQSGWDVWIYSEKRKSDLYGAQYLHGPIEDLTPSGEIPTMVNYRLEGSIEDYRQKVYGAVPVRVSPESLLTRHAAWDIRAAYDRAWELYGPHVIHFPMDSKSIGWVNGPLSATKKFDVIVSTLPMPALCYKPDLHQFHSASIWAYGDAPDRGQLAPYRPEEDFVECNGTSEVGWYRASNIHGHVTVEWPGRSKPPLPGVAGVKKPIYTDCNCYRDGTLPRGTQFVPLGRYGQWSKGVLSHHAYTQAMNL